jgi:VIT1/CCC1 family predicted Fe2+/Mn2+ transporter
MEHDGLGAHARKEIEIVAETSPRPIMAGLFSALAFMVGALLPLLTA